MTRSWRALVIGCLMAFAGFSSAHELKTVTLRFDELNQNLVDVLLNVPQLGEESPHSVIPEFDKRCQIISLSNAQRGVDSIERRWRLRCLPSLANTRVQLHGLDPRMPDALIMVNFTNGVQENIALDRHDPVRTLGDGLANGNQALSNYFGIGVSHILRGPDHLLFVLGLLLMVAIQYRGIATLIAAITAFTLAHSLTLAMGLMGIWGLSAKPVEILIAGSILLLAYELHQYQPSQPSISFRQPWLVAFGFGLLHGFGFAGALSDVGLPDEAKAWALLYFNLGVEAGQLGFVFVIWLLLMRLQKDAIQHQKITRWAATGLGGIACFWLFDRVSDWISSSYPQFILRGIA